MRVAVLTLTRDRIAFTRHCFDRLRELAGCPFDHFVLDQGSTDETREWLDEQEYQGWLDGVVYLPGNVGVSRGMNRLLDLALSQAGYDVVVKFDNDCELTVDGTLAACAEVALAMNWIVSPHIQGLDSPPVVEYEVGPADFWKLRYRVGVPNIMGGIFMAAPASLYATYRHDDANPIWGMDDARIVDHWRALGNEVGYLLDYPANHYLTTQGQRETDPVYYARKEREFAA